jgi:acetyltransferase-like isoleucine patch superfamily enzyme
LKNGGILCLKRIKRRVIRIDAFAMRATRNFFFFLCGFRILAQDLRDAIWQVILRSYWADRGLWIHRKALITGSRSESHLFVDGPAWLDAFSILDVRDHPKHPSGSGSLSLGKNVYIGEKCNLRAGGASISIGNDVMIAAGASIFASNHSMETGLPMIKQPWNCEGAGVVVGSDVWIGSRSVLLPGCRIGDGVVVAAGAVVRGEVSSGAVVGGVPAKEIRRRNGF